MQDQDIQIQLMQIVDAEQERTGRVFDNDKLWKVCTSRAPPLVAAGHVKVKVMPVSDLTHPDEWMMFSQELLSPDKTDDVLGNAVRNADELESRMRRRVCAWLWALWSCEQVSAKGLPP
jgi:hypothetical protein